MNPKDEDRCESDQVVLQGGDEVGKINVSTSRPDLLGEVCAQALVG